MRINLRGGGDIASNPARERCRMFTSGRMHGAGPPIAPPRWVEQLDAPGSGRWVPHGAGEAIPGPARPLGAEKVSGAASPPQKPATGQEGGLNAKCWDALPENIARWLKEHNAPHPPKDGAHE